MMFVLGEPAMWVEWDTPEENTTMTPPVLDILKGRHTDNYGWALACCRWQREMAEDVLQEAYLRVFDGRAVFAGRSTHKTWFFAVIKRVAMEWQRRQKRRAILELRLVRNNPATVESPAHWGSDSPAQMLQQEESTRELRDALMQLSVRQREVLHLVFYGEMTLEEAAETLGLSVGSARTHYHRGKLRLADMLGMEQSNEQDR